MSAEEVAGGEIGMLPLVLLRLRELLPDVMSNFNGESVRDRAGTVGDLID